MYLKKDSLRIEQVQYRCTTAHKEKVIATQKLIQKGSMWSKVSLADVMERALNELHQSLIKPVTVTKPIAKKKTIIKPKAIKK